MEVSELIWILSAGFILSNSAVLGLVFLVAKSSNRRANIFLGLFFWSIAGNLLNDLLSEFQINEGLGVSLFIVEPFLLNLPLLFLYLLATMNKEIRTWHFLLFLPGVLHNVLIRAGGLFLEEGVTTIFETIVYFLEIFLLVYAYSLLQYHYKRIANYYSDLENKTLTWLKSIFALNVLIHLLSISTFIGDLSHMEILEFSIDTFAIGLTLFMVFWTAYNGFSQPEIFKQHLSLTTHNLGSTETTILKKTRDVNLEKDVISELDIQRFNAIKELIQEQELFTKPKLTLRDLSEVADLKEKELSRLINECGQSNFYQLINGYRIEKFKALSETSKAYELSIWGLAMEVGFTSKSAFFSLFKEHEGMTPLQYQKTQKKSS
ncbi:MAG: AraC family transcriptional regulator [Bacteroidetes bacterium]|nr:AraC family transcriptional regulator [Bacteroidota bacterium]